MQNVKSNYVIVSKTEIKKLIELLSTDGKGTKKEVKAKLEAWLK